MVKMIKPSFEVSLIVLHTETLGSLRSLIVPSEVSGVL